MTLPAACDRLGFGALKATRAGSSFARNFGRLRAKLRASFTGSLGAALPRVGHPTLGDTPPRSVHTARHPGMVRPMEYPYERS